MVFNALVYSGIYAQDRGALFCGVYIGRFYRGEWRFFEECTQNRLTAFLFSCIIGVA